MRDKVPDQLIISSLSDFPMIAPGDDLAVIIVNSLARNDLVPEDGDILVLAQKIVSKAEGQIVDLCSVGPGADAQELGKVTDKDPRVVELILRESKSVLRQVSGVLITEHKRGWIMANAGIDASNVQSDTGEENVLLLPEDPDQSCTRLREQLRKTLGVKFGILISDSFGRPWRLGTTGVAIGAAGLPSLWDRRGESDLFGRELMVSQQAIADELAAAASLLQGQAGEGRPVVLVRGLDLGENVPDGPASDLLRPVEEDLFR